MNKDKKKKKNDFPNNLFERNEENDFTSVMDEIIENSYDFQLQDGE